MYEVILSACGNLDHNENPYSNIVDGILIKPDVARANTIEGCQKAVRDYIEENFLGAGNWEGGNVFKDGKRIGYISYNGRYWANGTIK